ncbi:vWA domain-containing protein [Mameliella alba]|uniref:Marine proteobacterial sortase target protein n=1 Tax=Mameliella alba TaxID=561184 RepID=A0A0B3RHT2_9RHOB|nr:vWA domain-containing protein [Mameliella alba]KHQ50855.1 marine proteobacterial sortase target protein [Mameliella alba]
MSKAKIVLLAVAGVVAASGFVFYNTVSEPPAYAPSTDMGTVDWEALAAWPPLIEVPDVETLPDPDRIFTMIVLDDSGSMGSDLEQAKAAVLQAVRMMDPNDRVGVLALNAGLVLPFETVEDAADILPGRLSPLRSTGSTPLGPALSAARDLLSEEAARSRSFGTYRIIVTTDGAADDPDLLVREVIETVNKTPVQVATIGIGIGRRHVLNAEGHTSYVAVDDVGKLAQALQAAVAENASFDPITAFDGEN